MYSHEQYLALRERAAIVDRSDRGRLRLGGSDRRAYLQGLLTNDVAALAPGTGCYAALLTAQGRMIADMRVLETGEEIVLDLAGAVTRRVHDHLEQFIFSEDVTVEDTTTATSADGVFGPDAAAVVAAALAGGGAPAAGELERMRVFDNLRLTFGGAPLLLVRSDDFGIPGFDLFAGAGERTALVDALSASGAARVSSEVAEVCRIEAARPLFGNDMDEDTIPLEAGIEDRAISLTKGCYVGQEVIIRVLHRGHGRVARRLVGLRIEPGAGVPAAGTQIRSGEREIGRVTSAAFSLRVGGPLALGYVQRDFVAPGTAVTIGAEPHGQAAVVVQTPFV